VRAPAEPDDQKESSLSETPAPEAEPTVTVKSDPEPTGPQSEPKPGETSSDPEPTILLTELPTADTDQPVSPTDAADNVPPDEAEPAAVVTGDAPTWDMTAVAQNPVPPPSNGLAWLPGAIVLLPILLPDGGSSSDGPPDEEVPPTPELSSSVLILLGAGAGYGLLRLSRRRRKPGSVP
jgi:hypothetical protein